MAKLQICRCRQLLLLCTLGLVRGNRHFLTEDQLPSGYLADWSEQNPALPDECLTHEQRYDAPSLDKRLEELAEANVDSKHVVVMKLHMDSSGFKADQALAYKALAAEVMESGYHFFILHERVEDPALTRWQALELLPKELHPFIIFHDFAEPLGTYDLLKKGTQNFEGDLGPGPLLAYMPTMNFMKRYAKYEWLWEIEYDVRYIGHWGRFLNSVLHIAHVAEPTKAWDKAETLHKSKRRARHMHDLPELSASSNPDLVFFGTADHGDKWQQSQVGMNSSTVWHASIMVWGGSRKLFSAMLDMSEKGQGSYVESFLLHAADEHNLKVVPVALPGEDGSYSCCHATGPNIYLRFVHGYTSDCTHSALLHPIKTCGESWPTQPNTTFTKHPDWFQDLHPRC